MSILGKITGFDQARGALMLVGLVGLVAAGATLTVMIVTARADARDLERQAELICSAAGSQFAAPPAKAAAKSRKADRGKLCLARIRVLASFEHDTNTATAGILAGAAAEQTTKATKDAVLATADAVATRAALKNMEAKDAAVEDDQVGDDWFDAVNRLGGLRDGPGRPPAADRGGGEGGKPPAG